MAKEPMIGREQRPTATDFEAPISDMKLRDLMAVIEAQIRPEKEILKSEKEFHKPEKELLKTEKEFRKPEGFKPEKEFLKPEKELSKPEKEAGRILPEQVEQIAQRVAELMKNQR
jgi:hypothetical protein